MNSLEIRNFVMQRRKTLGLTQFELAKRAGVSRECISRFENDSHEIGLMRLERICLALGLEVFVRVGRGRPVLEDLAEMFPDEEE